jgi:hypothetical protein
MRRTGFIASDAFFVARADPGSASGGGLGSIRASRPHGRRIIIGARFYTTRSPGTSAGKSCLLPLCTRCRRTFAAMRSPIHAARRAEACCFIPW